MKILLEVLIHLITIIVLHLFRIAMEHSVRKGKGNEAVATFSSRST